MDRLNNLLSWPRAEQGEQVAAAVDGWESALTAYTEPTGQDFPERFKVSLLLRMLPAECEAEVRMRYITGNTITYEALREIVDAWVVQPAGVDRLKDDPWRHS